MEDAAFWREPGAKFRHRAETSGDAQRKAEFSEHAKVCDEVAAEIEDRATVG